VSAVRHGPSIFFFFQPPQPQAGNSGYCSLVLQIGLAFLSSFDLSTAGVFDPPPLFLSISTLVRPLFFFLSSVDVGPDGARASPLVLPLVRTRRCLDLANRTASPAS